MQLISTEHAVLRSVPTIAFALYVGLACAARKPGADLPPSISSADLPRSREVVRRAVSLRGGDEECIFELICSAESCAARGDQFRHDFDEKGTRRTTVINVLDIDWQCGQRTTSCGQSILCELNSCAKLGEVLD